jgi:hypothetical protein
MQLKVPHLVTRLVVVWSCGRVVVGGGLSGGIAVAIKALWPSIIVVAAEVGLRCLQAVSVDNHFIPLAVDPSVLLCVVCALCACP